MKKLLILSVLLTVINSVNAFRLQNKTEFKVKGKIEEITKTSCTFSRYDRYPHKFELQPNKEIEFSSNRLFDFINLRLENFVPHIIFSTKDKFTKDQLNSKTLTFSIIQIPPITKEQLIQELPNLHPNLVNIIYEYFKENPKFEIIYDEEATKKAETEAEF